MKSSAIFSSNLPLLYFLYSLLLVSQLDIHSVQFSSFAQSCPTLRPRELQHTRPPCPSSTLRVYTNSCPLSWWCHPTISSSVVPFSFCLQSFPASGSFPLSQVAKLLELQLHHRSFQWIFKVDFLQDWLVWSLCSPRDSQESSPTPQFKSISSSALSFLYGPTLMSIHDHWKNHSFN